VKGNKSICSLTDAQIPRKFLQGKSSLCSVGTEAIAARSILRAGTAFFYSIRTIGCWQGFQETSGASDEAIAGSISEGCTYLESGVFEALGGLDFSIIFPYILG